MPGAVQATPQAGHAAELRIPCPQKSAILRNGASSGGPGAARRAALPEAVPMKDRPLIDVAPHRETICLPPSATVQQACTTMREAGVSAVLVTDDEDRLVGIFTGRDAVCRVLAEARDPAATTLGAVMTDKVSVLGPRDRAMDALHLMHDGGFRHVPVVAGGRVRTLVLRSDFRALERAQIEAEDEIFARLR
jgi:CBS domain-containing protein